MNGVCVCEGMCAHLYKISVYERKRKKVYMCVCVRARARVCARVFEHFCVNSKSIVDSKRSV